MEEIRDNFVALLPITQHERFVPYGTHPNFRFAKDFFYAGTVICPLRAEGEAGNMIF